MSDTPTPLDSEQLELVNIKIFLDENDSPIDSTYQITAVSIYKKINKINKAEIRFIDGDVASGEFPIMESGEFDPGTPIRIELGYGTGEENETAFQGIIAEASIQTHSGQKPLFIVRCVDKAFSMTRNARYLLYEQKKDSDLFSDMLDRYELEAGEIESTNYEYASIVQMGDTDWDLLLARAARAGLVVYTKQGKVFIKKPEAEETSVQVSFGKDIIRQQLSFTGRSLFSDVSASSWNATDQEVRTETAEEINLPQQGDSSTKSSDVASRFTDTPQKILSHSDIDTTPLSGWASGQLLAYELNKIQGQITVPGTNAPRLDTAIELLRVGNYFTGNGYITGLEHQVKNGKWTSTIMLGTKGIILPLTQTVQHTLPSQQLSNLRIGLVQQIHDDPAGNARVLVRIPGIEGESEGIWARLLQRYATDGAGSMFFPETGDEVILGFLDGNPQSPIILGSLYSQSNAPPFKPEEENYKKAFVSRSQLELSFDEDRKEILLATPEGNQIALCDEDKGIRLEDQNGNRLLLNNEGITMESASDIALKAKGNIIIEPAGNFEVNAKRDINAKAMNLSLSANMKLEEKANIIESKATARAVIKGGIVQIN